ncbi:MAG: TetR/AcrR family transcriptional regulator [Acidimicrobiia bacterium]|nr:TetR/AcrR family transcriptional regulator [Acidimicrobiia bacterium]
MDSPAPARDRLVEAAEAQFRRFGYRRSTVDDITRAAVTGKGSFYLHFPSKEAAYLAVVETALERFLDLAAAALHREGRPPTGCAPWSRRQRSTTGTTSCCGHRSSAAATWWTAESPARRRDPAEPDQGSPGRDPRSRPERGKPASLARRRDDRGGDLRGRVGAGTGRA